MSVFTITPPLTLWQRQGWSAPPFLGSPALLYHSLLLSLSASQASVFRVLMHCHRARPQSQMKQPRQSNHVLNGYQSKMSHLWVISNSKASKDLDGGDSLPPLRWVFGVWHLLDPRLLSLDHQGLSIEWQIQTKQQWLGNAAASVIWLCLQPAQLQPVSSYDTWKQQLLFQVNMGCFMA